MGNITDIEQDKEDVETLLVIAGLYPAYKRFLSHHTRNSIQGIMNYTEIINKNIIKIDDPKTRSEIWVAVDRIKQATDHLIMDLERVGV